MGKDFNNANILLRKKLFFYCIYHLCFKAGCTRFAIYCWVWMKVDEVWMKFSSWRASGVLSRNEEGLTVSICLLQVTGSGISSSGHEKISPWPWQSSLGPFSEEKRNKNIQDICDLYSHLPSQQVAAGKDLKVSILPWQNSARWDMMQFSPGFSSLRAGLQTPVSVGDAVATEVKGAARKITRMRLMVHYLSTLHPAHWMRQGPMRVGKRTILGFCLLKFAS